MNNHFHPRRFIVFGIMAALFAEPAFAISKGKAIELVERLVGEISLMINSVETEMELTITFERIVAKYADMNVISRSTLGPRARGATESELKTFKKAFQGYFARKYSKQFQGFAGSQIILKDSKDRGKFFEVGASIVVDGSSNIDVNFRVSDRSGEPRFFDIILEGISLLSSERVEIGALLDKWQGDIGLLSKDIEELG
jgi:phospholipid transport system substrate-binding protein